MPITTLPNAFARSWGKCGIQVNFAGQDRRQGGYERHCRSKDWWGLNILMAGHLKILTAKDVLTIVGPAAYLIPPQMPFREIAIAGSIEHFTAGFYVLLGQNQVNPLLALAFPQIVSIQDLPLWLPFCQEASDCFRKHRVIDFGHNTHARLPIDRLLNFYLTRLPPDFLENLNFHQNAPQWVSDVRDRILKNLPNPDLTFATMLAWSGFTASHVNHAFKRAYGTSPMRFVREERMMLAKKYITNTPHENVSLLALKCGYQDPSLFTRHFTAKFGVSPRLYRQRAV